RESLGQGRVRGVGSESVLDQYRIGKVRQGTHRLRLHPRLGIALRQCKQPLHRFWALEPGHDPDGMQPPADAELAILQGLDDRLQTVLATTLDGFLSLAALEGTWRIEPAHELIQSSRLLTTFRRDCRLLPLFPDVTDLINPPTSPARALAVRPVGDEKRTIAVHDQVRWFEPVGVIPSTSGKLDLLERRKGGTGTFG